MIRLRRVVWQVAVVLFLSWNLFSAQEKVSEKKKSGKEEQEYVEVREEVVVTATLSLKPLKLCSRSVAVIGTSDLEAIPSVSALSLLENTAGVFLSRSGEFGRTDPDIRGIGQNGRRIAVLVDGRPEKMGLFGCAVTHAFPLDNVERIEVVRGPASVLYGGEAMGGAIHIRTRLPEKGFQNRLELSGGSYTSRAFNLSHGGADKRLRYLLTFDHRSSDGFRPQSAYLGNSATGRFAWSLPAGGEIRFQARYFAGDKDEPGPIEQPSPGYFTRYHRGTLDLGYHHAGARTDWEARIYHNFGHHRFSDGWHSRDNTSGGLLRFTTRDLEDHDLTMGLDLRLFGGQSLGQPRGEWHKWEAALFVHDDWIPGQRWVVSGGMRLHNDSSFGLEVVPRLGLVFLPPGKVTLRVSLSRGFRSPQLNELEVFPSANLDLKPERMWNLETGFEARLLDGLTLEATIFRMQGTNLIRLVPRQGTVPPFRFENIDEFIFTGMEAGLRARLSSYLNLGFNYSRLYSGDWTQGRPGHRWNLDLRYGGSRIRFFMQGQYVSDYHAGDNKQNPLPDYLVFNARMIFRILRGVQIRLDMLNLTDENYLVFGEFPGVALGSYPMPGRHFRLGVVIDV